MRAALDAGITTFDTADVYANTKAEAVLGEALKGERRESLEIFTKVYWPDRARGHNDRGLSRKHIMESIDGSLTPAADRLRRPLPGAPLRLRDAARGDDAGVRRRRPRRARRSTSASASGPPSSSATAHALATELGFQLISNQPQYSMLWRVIEAEVVPTSRGARHLAGRLVADRPGRADRQVPAGPAAAGGLPGHRREGRRGHDRALDDATTCSTAVQQLKPIADEAGLSMAQLAVAWVLQNDERRRPRSSARPGRSRSHDNVKAAGREARRRRAEAGSTRSSTRSSSGTRPRRRELAEDPRGLIAALSRPCCKRRIWSQPSQWPGTPDPRPRPIVGNAVQAEVARNTVHANGSGLNVMLRSD